MQGVGENENKCRRPGWKRETCTCEADVTANMPTNPTPGHSFFDFRFLPVYAATSHVCVV